MHRVESAELIDCCDCGATISPSTDRAFGVGDEFLCLDCAIRRGGVYDEPRDRWTVPPNLSGTRHERRVLP